MSAHTRATEDRALERPLPGDPGGEHASRLPVELTSFVGRARELAVARQRLGASRLLRHQTLRAAIDRSYDLLAARERLLLERLAVFAGSFTLEAAETICASGEIAGVDVLDLVASLVEKSLLMLLESGDAARYRLLEAVRRVA